MLPPKPTTQSTENLFLKCQKETHKQCLPPEWSIHPPNKEILPPHDTLALAIQIDSPSLTRIDFLEANSNRSVGSILGAEYRGSIVVVPWRPGLKFVCVANCRRRSGCRVGVVREAKGTVMRKGAVAARTKKNAVVASIAADAAAKRSASRGRDISSNKTLDADGHRAAAVSSASSGGSPTRSRIPTFKGQRVSIKKYDGNRGSSFNAASTIGNKSRIPTRRVVEQSC